MLASTLFVRVVPADKDRGFVLLAGYDAAVVQRTALQNTSLSGVTRESLNAAIERLRVANSAAEVRDVTAPAIKKKLAKLFGEYGNAAPLGNAPAGLQLFGEMRIGSYL